MPLQRSHGPSPPGPHSAPHTPVASHRAATGGVTTVRPTPQVLTATAIEYTEGENGPPPSLVPWLEQVQTHVQRSTTLKEDQRLCCWPGTSPLMPPTRATHAHPHGAVKHAAGSELSSMTRAGPTGAHANAAQQQGAAWRGGDGQVWRPRRPSSSSSSHTAHVSLVTQQCRKHQEGHKLLRDVDLAAGIFSESPPPCSQSAPALRVGTNLRDRARAHARPAFSPRPARRSRGVRATALGPAVRTRAPRRRQ